MNNETNPYATYASNVQPKLHMDIGDQLKVHKDEERYHQAPKTLPFTGETLTEYLSQMYMILVEVKKCIDLTEKEPKRDKQAIKESLAIIETIGQKITLDLPNAIAKLEL